MHQQPLDALSCVGEVDLRFVDWESFDDGAEGKQNSAIREVSLGHSQVGN